MNARTLQSFPSLRPLIKPFVLIGLLLWVVHGFCNLLLSLQQAVAS